MMISSKLIRNLGDKLRNVRKFATKSEIKCREVKIPVPWGHIAAKWWGPMDKRPILSLHGWQDNCGTFDPLIPMLNKDQGYLTIDFPGHGLSSKIPHGLYYHGSSYITLIHYIKHFFNWQKVSLMGHSLGGIMSYTYGMIFPKNVDFLICIDAGKPLVFPHNNILMALKIDSFLKYSEYEMQDMEPPSYTMDEIVRKVCEPNNHSVLPETSYFLIRRNVAPSKIHKGKYYFTRDVRLKSGVLENFPQDEIVEYAQHMTFPIFICKSTKGAYYEIKENFYEVLDVLKRTSKDCDFNYVEGTHHVHLNNPERVADLINNFIRRNDTEDRNIGIKGEDIFKENIENISKL